MTHPTPPQPHQPYPHQPTGTQPSKVVHTNGAPASPIDPEYNLPKAVVDDVFVQSQTFESLGLRGGVLKGLDKAGYKHPTKIQSILIPAMLSGKDLLGQAKTGTGKTASFGLPLLHSCVPGVATQALILVPTRELCLQVANEINDLGQFTQIRAVAVYGGERIKSQVDALQSNPAIIVSTPGRLMDMVERGFVNLANVKHAVLDEVDRMLDIGFRDDIRKILNMCPPPGQRQTVFVSATISPEIERLARAQAQNAEKLIAVTQGALTTALVKQFYLSVQPWDKRKLLLHLLTHEDAALTLVFCRMKRTVDEVNKYLASHKIDSHAMHGDMQQNKRNRVIERLHKGDLAVLIASDLASRGLDIDGITHVINYDMPEDPEVYVHRIGRTARIGREGVAWSFVTSEQGELLTNVELLINMEIPKLDYPDFKASPPPRGMGQAFDGPVVKPQATVGANRYAATVNPTLPVTMGAQPSHSAAHAAPAPVVDTSRFPGGIVPSKLPPNRMFGRVKTTRGMRASGESLPPQNPPPAPPAPPANP